VTTRQGAACAAGTVPSPTVATSKDAIVHNALVILFNFPSELQVGRGLGKRRAYYY
jgi:hypothetical protein